MEFSSGNEVELTVDYKNIERFGLKDVEIAFRYPEGFEFSAADPVPSNEFHDIWDLGAIKGNGKGKITIRGKIIGEVGSFITFKSSVTYQPENFNSSFKQDFSSNTGQITASIVAMDIEGAERIIPDQSVQYSVHFVNSSEEELSNILILAKFPQNFVFTESAPQFSKKEDFISKKLYFSEDNETDNSLEKQWLVEKISKGEKMDIIISGKYLNSENEKFDLLFQIGTVDEKEFKVYQEKKLESEVINHGLSINMTVNGQKGELPVNFSDTLNYSIALKNIGTKTLYNLDVLAEINSEVVDWDTLIDKNSGERVSDKILWHASGTPVLAILKPLYSVTIDFSVKIKDILKIDLQKDNLKTTAYAQTQIKKIDDFDTDVIIRTEQQVSDINTELEMRAEGRYFDDDNIAVGQGPLPPVIGKKTTFRIYWYLSNNLNEVSSVVVKTALSPDSVWSDKFSSTVGTLVYNQSDNSIVWKIPKISPNKSFEDLTAWFDVSITPKDDQVGKLILLVTDTSLSAKDNVTNSPISLVERGVTSNLEDDPVGGGRGLVEKSE